MAHKDARSPQPLAIVVTPATHTVADLLAEAGRILYGDPWIKRLARDLEVSAATLRAWRAGRMHLSPADVAIRNTLRLLERRRDEVDHLAAVIRQVINETNPELVRK
jgi:hypothetical protein